jgi:hypothetical protein
VLLLLNEKLNGYNMPDLNDLIANIDKTLAALQAQVPKIAKTYAANALALSIQRIEKEGAKPGAKYSTKPFYAAKGVFNNKGAFKATGKVESERLKQAKADGKNTRRNAKDKVKEDGTPRKTMYLPGGYLELRQIQGLPVDVVNLEYSRRMLSNTTVLKVDDKQPYIAAGIVGASQAIEKKKLQGQHKKFGDFLRPAPEETKRLNTEALDELSNIAKAALKI